MRYVKRFFVLVFVIFLLPAIASAGLWAIRDKPSSWREAKWSSSGLLPKADDQKDAAVYVFSAMTGGFKGALASHAWIVTKERNAARYNRYDKVGWGNPIRVNNYPPDAFWYSNPPRQVIAIKGDEAERLIPKIEKAIAAYPYAKQGGYQIYPGPNSNTFVAHVLRSVPELGVALPPDAVGRDYVPNAALFHVDDDWKDVHVSWRGLIGVAAGVRSGFEVHLLGLVAGIDVVNPGIKIPGLGWFGVQRTGNIAI